MRFRYFGTAGMLLALGFAGCGAGTGGAARCGYENWSGMCTLRSVNTLRQVEFPQPHSVLEVIYSPVGDAMSMQTPPDVREEFTVLSNQEAEFRDYLQNHGSAPCQVQPGSNGACANIKV